MKKKQTLPPLLPLEEGLIELAQEGDPHWIWARPCRAPDCDCRSAIIVASRAGREALIESAVAAKKILDHPELAPGLVVSAIREDCAVFRLDIDTAETEPMRTDDSETGVPPEETYPWLVAFLPRIDGEALEQIGRLWFRAKGLPDPEMAHQPPEDVANWQPGAKVSWEEAYCGVRDDLYVIGSHLYEAAELYCVTPGCECERVDVRFKHARKHIGIVSIGPSGEPEFEVEVGPRDLLNELWAAYQKRHPAWRDRQARRSVRMTEFGRVLHAWHAAKFAPKVSPNSPCPCGSGNKYKKCCWRKTLAGGGALIQTS